MSTNKEDMAYKHRHNFCTTCTYSWYRDQPNCIDIDKYYCYYPYIDKEAGRNVKGFIYDGSVPSKPIDFTTVAACQLGNFHWHWSSAHPRDMTNVR